MSEPARLTLGEERDTVELGEALARTVTALAPSCLHLHLAGDLGTGKTTFARGFLRGLGHEGRVPSPTYTLVEPYEAGGFTVLHVDLYRLQRPEEVDALDLESTGDEPLILLIEWPEIGSDRLRTPDLCLAFTVHGDPDRPGRQVVLQAETGTGAALLQTLGTTI